MVVGSLGGYERRGVRVGIYVIVGVLVVGAAGLATISPLGAQLALLAVGAIFALSVIAISRRDAQTVLTLFILLLFLIPQDYVLAGPLRSVGNPALLVGLAALALWCAGRILGSVAARELHPIRWILLIYAVACLVAFASGMNRILSIAESAGALRTLFPLAAALGVGLLAVDGLAGRRGAEAVLQRLVWVGGIAALAGIVEFLDKGFSYRDFMHLPGLVTNTELINDTRSGFDRINGAASHPIEYAVTLAALAPLALHFTLYAKTRGMRQLNGLALGLILIVNPMTVARSGIVALTVGLMVYFVQLSTRARINLAVLAVVGLVMYRVAVPGLLGTLKSLLLIGDADPSIAGRTEDYAKIPGLMRGYELFGRGLGTFQPLQYFFVDNQYLGSLLEGGVLELFAVILLFIVGTCVARGIRHRSDDPALRGLGQALAASIAAFAACGATFDELSFRQSGFTVFLLLGCAGALWSAQQDHPKRRWSGKPRSDAPRVAVAE